MGTALTDLQLHYKTRKHSNLYHISETMQNQQPQYYAQKLQVLSN